MTPTRTSACNIVLGVPRDWNTEADGDCVALPIHADAVRCLMHSYWKPSEQDISNILAGQPIRLTVFGPAHPPVAVAVTAGAED